METGQFLAGTPDSLTEAILSQSKSCNAGVMVIRPEAANLSLDEVAENMELFAREVLPVLHKA
jgi:hypothetical protein